MTLDPSNRRISLRDMAKLLGVSHATVSLALRNSPKVSLAQQSRIKQFAEEIGYRPDPFLSALAGYRQDKSTRSIQAALAWINAWDDSAKLRSYKEFDLYWKGASEAAEKFGYRMEEFQIDSRMPPQRLHHILETRGIRGILLPPHAIAPNWVDFPWESYAITRLGRTFSQPRSHLVTADQVANTITAIRAIQERGYQKIGFVTHKVEMGEVGHLFAAGFLGAQDALDKEARLPLFKISDHPTRRLHAEFLKWFHTHQPDAIFSATDETPALLAACGMRVPEDVALAVSSIQDGGADSGIDQHPEEIGRVGVLLLNSLLQDRAYGIPRIFRQILVEGKWVDGSSLPMKNGMVRIP